MKCIFFLVKLKPYSNFFAENRVVEPYRRFYCQSIAFAIRVATFSAKMLQHVRVITLSSGVKPSFLQ